MPVLQTRESNKHPVSPPYPFPSRGIGSRARRLRLAHLQQAAASGFTKLARQQHRNHLADCVATARRQ